MPTEYSDPRASSDESTLNPFAPPEVSRMEPPENVETKQIYSTTYANPLQTICVWFVVCTISAIPGFIWGFQMAEPIGMVLGVLTFIAFYIGADYLTRRTVLRENRRLRRVLQIGYWVRLVISIIFPIGMAVDLYAGMVAMLITGERAGELPVFNSIVHSYITTILTGVLINLGLFVFMLAVLSVWWLGAFVVSSIRSSRNPDEA